MQQAETHVNDKLQSEGAMAAEQFGQVEAAQGEEEEADANAEQPADDFAADQPADDFTAEQSAQDATSGVEAELAEPLSGSTEMDATDATDTPSQDDKAAATLSKELRKLQAESAVLQEHSRRLQEKAAEIQQKRTSIDQVGSRGHLHQFAHLHGACMNRRLLTLLHELASSPCHACHNQTGTVTICTSVL